MTLDCFTLNHESFLIEFSRSQVESGDGRLRTPTGAGQDEPAKRVFFWILFLHLKRSTFCNRIIHLLYEFWWFTAPRTRPNARLHLALIFWRSRTLLFWLKHGWKQLRIGENGQWKSATHWKKIESSVLVRGSYRTISIRALYLNFVQTQVRLDRKKA